MKELVNAIFAPWHEGNFCILPCGHFLPPGGHAKFTCWPGLKNCTPARLKVLHHGSRSAEKVFQMSAGFAPVNRAKSAHHSMTT
jgi:hypothetical protein